MASVQGFRPLGVGAERAVVQRGGYAFKIPLTDAEYIPGGNLWESHLWDSAPSHVKVHLAPVLAYGAQILVMPYLKDISVRDHGWVQHLARLERLDPFFSAEDVGLRRQWGQTPDGRYLLRDYGFKWRW